MGAWESALWGLAGGAAAGVLSLMTSVIANDFAWWDKKERGPRLFVFGCSVFLAALVAAAASSEMSGPWPAFVIGAGAPATMRGLLSGVEVRPVELEVKPLRRGARAGQDGTESRREEADEDVR